MTPDTSKTAEPDRAMAPASKPRWRPTLTATMIAGALASVLAAGSVMLFFLARGEREIAMSGGAETAAVVLARAEHLLTTEPDDEVRRAFATMVTAPTVERAVIWSPGGLPLAEYTARVDSPLLARPSTTVGQHRGEARVLMWRPVGNRGHRAAVSVDTAPALLAARHHVLGLLLIGAVTAAAALGVLYGMVQAQARQVRSLAQAAGEGLQGHRRRVPLLSRWAAREFVALRQAVVDAQRAQLHDRQELLRLEALVRATGEGAMEALIVHEISGRILAVNRAAERLCGLTGAELRQRRVQDVLAEVDARAMDLAMDLLQRDGEHPLAGQPAFLTLVTPQGQRIPVRAVAQTMTRHHGRIVTLHCVDRRDELQRVAELEEAVKAATEATETKSRFLAMVSHEVRTPLNGMAGMLDLLAHSGLNDDQRELAQGMRASIRLLRSVLNHVLDLSKIEAGKLEIERIPFDLRAQAEHCARGYSGLAQERGLSLHVHADVHDRMLLGDPNRIAQVLNNLLDNAFKFTAQGRITVDVQTSGGDGLSDLREVWITVEDTGIGIPADRMESIFLPFAQADQSISRKYGGTGLGLALCRQLCEAMGGSLSVASEPGKGSTFTALVRCEVAHGLSPFVETQPLPVEALTPLQGATVLVADDNRINQTLLRRWLAHAGMRVLCVDNGDQAVQTVLAQHVDVVLMDVLMPVMSGLDATRAIRGLGERGVPAQAWLRELPIIAVTASAMSGDREQCLFAGMTDYVTKPIERHDLLSKIARALRPRAPVEARPIELEVSP